MKEKTEQLGGRCRINFIYYNVKSKNIWKTVN